MSENQNEEPQLHRRLGVFRFRRDVLLCTIYALWVQRAHVYPREILITDASQVR